MPDLSFERALSLDLGGGAIAGLDEVGRGPWAGPVMACAVVLPDPMHPTGGLPGDLFAALDDSKKLGHAERERLYDPLRSCVAHGFGTASVAEIDNLNVLQASLLAMRRALSAVSVPVAGALVDGNRDPGFGIPTRLIVKGDSLAISIAAASILAKVARDRLMIDLATVYPGYGWDTNMGYGTKRHQAGLQTHGVTPEHRKSFAPIRARLAADINI